MIELLFSGKTVFNCIENIISKIDYPRIFDRKNINNYIGIIFLIFKGIILYKAFNVFSLIFIIYHLLTVTYFSY